MKFKYRAEYVFEPPQSTQKKRQRISILADNDDVSSVDDLKKRGEQELRTYVSNPRSWNRSYFGVEFANPPWSQAGEPPLEEALNNLDGVQWVRYESPMDGAYRAPRYHLGVVSGEKTAVENRVQDYYSGLVVSDSEGGDLTVIMSSLETLSV